MPAASPVRWTSWEVVRSGSSATWARASSDVPSSTSDVDGSSVLQVTVAASGASTTTSRSSIVGAVVSTA